MSYSEFRSALYNDRHIEAFQIMKSLDHPDEKQIANKLWWQMVKSELITPDLVWTGKEDNKPSLWYLDKIKWTLSLSGVIIATNETLDLNTIQAKWATVPARHVLPIWEDWAKDNAPERLHCVRELLDLLDQNADPKTIERAKEATNRAANAAWDAGTAGDAARDTWAAARAGRAAARAGRAGRAAAWGDADYAARSTAWAASNTTARATDLAGPSYDSEYSRWCLEWTKHVFSILKKTHS